MDGFYLVCCKEHDSSVRLMHTHRDYFKAYLDWYVEKGTIRFYDLHVELKMGRLGSTELEYEPTVTSILLLGLDHSNFTVDYCLCKEKPAS